jgi:hypothetical protein
MLDFGTLRVTTPDGQVREYPIDAQSAIIGRAEGNRVMVDHVSVSRRHARLDFSQGTPTLEDLSSATGTYVAGERLMPGAPRPINPGDPIRIGDCQAVFTASASVGGQPDTGMPGRTSAGEQVTAVWLAAPSTPVAPGAAVSATVTVQNRGEVPDTVTLSVQGIPEHWVRITRTSLQLVPDARDEVVVVIQPPRDPSSRAGDYEFAAAARSAQRGIEVRSVGKLTILPFGGVQMKVSPAQSRRTFALSVENNSNSVQTLDLQGEDANDAVLGDFQPGTVVVDPGSAVSVRLDARPKRKRFFGGEERHPFSVRATGAAQPIAAAAELIERPPWLILRWLLLGLVIVGAAAGGWFAYNALAGDDNPTAPGNETPTATETDAPGTPTEAATEPPTPEPPTPDDGTLREGSTAIVVNSPEGSCLLVRRAPTRVATDPQSEAIDRLCDGALVTILGDRTEAENFFWYPVRTANNVEGWAAEGPSSGAERYLEPAP